MVNLPHFVATDKNLRWVKSEKRTARIINILWKNSTKKDRSNPKFLGVLARCAWINSGTDEATRKWRNKHISDWLGFQRTTSDNQLAEALSEKLHLSHKLADSLIKTSTGITHYYQPLRPAFMAQLKRHTKDINKAFVLISEKRKDPESKIAEVAELILSIPEFSIPRRKGQKRGKTSVVNGITPVLACLDPQRCFPIVNQPVERLLSTLGKKTDVQGITSLSRLIGQYGIHNSFYLDVYALRNRKRFKPANSRGRVQSPTSREIGIKAEEDSIKTYNKRSVRIRHLHNQLINKFKLTIEWKYKPEENVAYDALIRDWKNGRGLLFEAKTETDGVTGRTQIRQAIGQLFDYRWKFFRNKEMDLALLTPKKPDNDILGLLQSLNIESFWFSKSRLEGTKNLLG